MMGIEKERIDFMKRSWICLGAIGMLLCGCTGTQNEMAEKGKEMKKKWSSVSMASKAWFAGKKTKQ